MNALERIRSIHTQMEERAGQLMEEYQRRMAMTKHALDLVYDELKVLDGELVWKKSNELFRLVHTGEKIFAALGRSPEVDDIIRVTFDPRGNCYTVSGEYPNWENAYNPLDAATLFIKMLAPKVETRTKNGGDYQIVAESDLSTSKDENNTNDGLHF